MGRIFDQILSTALVILAVIMCGTYAYRTFVPSEQARAAVPPTAVRMPRWSDAVAAGYTLSGDTRSTSTMLVFGDLQCPACRAFHATVRNVISTHPRDVRVEYVAFPLPYHVHALAAAKATECVRSRGHIKEWMDAVYAKQDSLGIKAWSAYARDASIRDTAGINLCADTISTRGRIADGMRLGQDLNLRGTPTIAINGWLLPNTPTQQQIDSAISRASKD